MSRRSLILVTALFSLLLAGPVQAQGAGTETPGATASATSVTPAVAAAAPASLPQAYRLDAPGIRGFYERHAAWAWLQAILVLLIVVPFIARGVSRLNDDVFKAPTQP